MSQISEVNYPENFKDLDADLYQHLLTEVSHLQKRNQEIIKDNEELRQKTQIVVNRVETNIVEARPGMDKETAEKISELEAKLNQAVYEVEAKVKEIEDLQRVVIKINALEVRLESTEGENNSLRRELSERVEELEIFRRERLELEQLNKKYVFDLNEQAREIESLRTRVKELELLPDVLAQVRRDKEVLAADVERLTSLLEGRDREIERLNGVIAVLETEKCISPAEHETLQVKIKEIAVLNKDIASLSLLKDVIRDLEAENERILLNLKDSEATNQQLRLRIEELLKTIDGLQEQIDFKDATISEMEKRRMELIAEMERFKIESAEYLTNVITEKNAKIVEQNHEWSVINNELEMLRKEMAKLVQDFNTVVIERDNLFKILNTRDSQISSLTESLSTAEMQIKKFTTDLDAASVKISTLENEYKNLAAEMSLMQAENQKLVIKVAELEEFKKILEAVTIERDTLLAEVRELTLQNDNFINKVNQLQVELENSRAKLDQTQIILEQITLERDTKITEIKDLTLRTAEFIAENNRLIEELKDRERTIEDLTKVRSELKTKIVSLTESLQILQHDKDDLAVKFEALKSENSHLQQTVNDLLTQKEHFLALIDQRDNLTAALNKDVVRLTQENKDLAQSEADLQQQCTGLSTVLHEREIETDKLKKMVERTFPEIEALTNKTKYYAAEFDKIEKLNKVQDEELNSLRQQLGLTDELKEKIKELSAQNAELRERIEELERTRAEFIRLQQELAIVVAERDKLIGVIRDKDNEIKNLRFVVGEYEELRIRYKESESEIMRLSSTLSQKDSFIRDLESRIAYLESLIESQKAIALENEGLRREFAEVNAKYQSLEYTVVVTNEKYKKLEDLYQDLKSATNHLGAVHEKLVETVEETDRVNQSLKTTDVYQQKVVVSEKHVEEQFPQRF